MLEMMLSAFVLGVAVAIPPGSVTIEAGRRAITTGFGSAFTFNLGSMSADTLYVLLVYAGLAPLVADNEAFRLGLWVVGGGWLIWLGVSAIRTRLDLVAASTAENDRPPESAWRGYLSGVGVTLLNPVTILAWISLAGSFFANWGADWPALERFGVVAVGGMLAGVMAWMVALMAILSRLRRFMSPGLVRAFSVGAGLFLVGYGLHAWASAWRLVFS